MSDNDPTYWKRCSTCKKEILFETEYYLCSVSTCKHPRKGFRFCSVPCWDAHLGYANHREAWAEEARAPSRDDFTKDALRAASASEQSSEAKLLRSESNTQADTEHSQASDQEILVVVSKVKKLIASQSGFNTSKCCIEALTKKVMDELLKAVEEAKRAGRKTVMGRDIK